MRCVVCRSFLTRSLKTRTPLQVPEAAKMVLFQEEKLKGYYHDLRWLLDEYHRVVTRVIPVTVGWCIRVDNVEDEEETT